MMLTTTSIIVLLTVLSVLLSCSSTSFCNAGSMKFHSKTIHTVYDIFTDVILTIRHAAYDIVGCSLNYAVTSTTSPSTT
ncbi:unnamed protein product [Ixodes persulcatus]